MSCPRLAVTAAFALAALALCSSLAPAQTPPPAASPPAGAAAPAPAAPAAPAVPAQAPAQKAEPAPAPAPAPNADPFGQEVTLDSKPVVLMKGTATWDTAFETLKGAFTTLSRFLDKQGLKAAGPMIAVYMAPDDTGFQYQAEIPLAEAPKKPPTGEISAGTSPAGKVLKFVHRGSYDAMETTYEAITNYLDEKGLDAGDMYIEEYVTDPLKTVEEQLVVNIYIPVK